MKGVEMKKIKFSAILTYLFLILGAIIMVFPFFWMITGSFKTSQEVSVCTFCPILSALCARRHQFGNGLYFYDYSWVLCFFAAAFPGTFSNFRRIARDDDGAV